MKLSIIGSVYNEEKNIEAFLKEIARKFLNADLYKEVRYKDLTNQDKKKSYCCLFRNVCRS